MKITLQDIEAAIVKEQSYRFPDTNVVVVALTVENGYTAIGQSACADNVEFVMEDGIRYARSDAINDLWKVLGYELRTKLLEAKKNGDQS